MITFNIIIKKQRQPTSETGALTFVLGVVGKGLCLADLKVRPPLQHDHHIHCLVNVCVVVGWRLEHNGILQQTAGKHILQERDMHSHATGTARLLLSSVQFHDRLGLWGDMSDESTEISFQSFSAGGSCEQLWLRQGCPLFDIVHKALPLPTMASPILHPSGHFGDYFRLRTKPLSAVNICNMK